jgi:hypothetical protein
MSLTVPYFTDNFTRANSSAVAGANSTGGVGNGGNTASATLPGNTVVASSISVNTPATVVHGTSFTLTGTFTGSPPSLVDVQFDAAGFVTISSVFATVGNMWVASTVTAPAAGSHTVSVRESNAVSVVSAASGSFTVT